MDSLGDIAVIDGTGSHCRHVGHQMGLTQLKRFAEIGFVADPKSGALFGVVVIIQVVGRTNDDSGCLLFPHFHSTSCFNLLTGM